MAVGRLGVGADGGETVMGRPVVIDDRLGRLGGRAAAKLTRAPALATRQFRGHVWLPQQALIRTTALGQLYNIISIYNEACCRQR
jgi:hypothetical protein